MLAFITISIFSVAIYLINEEKGEPDNINEIMASDPWFKND